MGDGPVRAGSEALSLLAIPLNASIMQALGCGPKSLLELRRETGTPPQTTMRAYLRALRETGVVDRQRHKEFPGNVEYRLTDRGRDLLAVAEALSAWLALAPDGPTELGGGGAKSAIRALVGGWSTSIIRALVASPRSLIELDSAIPSISYPTLERRLGAMRLADLLEQSSSAGRAKPYAVSEWLRRAIAPIVAAARWERRHLPDEAPAVTDDDAEAAFLLALPLIQLPDSHSGSCRLGVQIGGPGASALAGAIARVEKGAVESQSTSLDGHVDAWVIGATGAWFAAVVDNDPGSLEVGGDATLAIDLLEALHGMLFGSRVAS